MHTQKYKPRRRKLYKGIRLEPSGIHKAGYFQDFDVGRSMHAPVKWQNEVAQLHFWNYSEKTPINEYASDLITHPGLYVRGSAIVVTGIETWYYWGEFMGDEKSVKGKFDHLTFKGLYRVLPSARWTNQQNLYNNNEDDFVPIKLAI